MNAKLWSISLAALISATAGFAANSYYLDAVSGNDANDGRSPEHAWKSLEKARGIGLTAGERLFLKRGASFRGHLELKAKGTAAEPVMVDAYGEGPLPKIDAAGYMAGVHILASSFLEVNNLEITSDAGEAREPTATKKRYGVLITAFVAGSFQHIALRSLHIHDIFASEPVTLNGKNKTSNPGMGIAISTEASAEFSDIVIENCRIERTGHKGIELHGQKRPGGGMALRNVQVLNNTLQDIGGPGIQPSTMEGLIVRGNTVDRSGSSRDPRMHGRGSGIWPWSCDDVLIEKNRFMHARGKADSCGAHIDYNCRNVVVQHNLSVDNEGGFIEILGNDFNCAYRYNISVNDGFWVKGANGAQQEGKVLWLTGYIGKAPKTGPTYSYIYNNTIYVKKDLRACFSFGKTTDGVLVANNIFHILGSTENVTGDQDSGKEPPGAEIRNVIFRNNLYCRNGILPPTWSAFEGQMLLGDAQFAHPGGFEPADYVPGAKALVHHKGIAIEKLSGDSIGLKVGLAVPTDFFGKPIIGVPSLGAIEVGD
jgi:hypothetical protein